MVYFQEEGNTDDASTTSRPHGEIDIDPTGLSTSNEPSLSKVELPNAEAGSAIVSSSIMENTYSFSAYDDNVRAVVNVTNGSILSALDTMAEVSKTVSKGVSACT